MVSCFIPYRDYYLTRRKKHENLMLLADPVDSKAMSLRFSIDGDQRRRWGLGAGTPIEATITLNYLKMRVKLKIPIIYQRQSSRVESRRAGSDCVYL